VMLKDVSCLWVFIVKLVFDCLIWVLEVISLFSMMLRW